MSLRLGVALLKRIKKYPFLFFPLFSEHKIVDAEIKCTYIDHFICYIHYCNVLLLIEYLDTRKPPKNHILTHLIGKPKVCFNAFNIIRNKHWSEFQLKVASIKNIKNYENCIF